MWVNELDLLGGAVLPALARLEPPPSLTVVSAESCFPTTQPQHGFSPGYVRQGDLLDSALCRST